MRRRWTTCASAPWPARWSIYWQRTRRRFSPTTPAERRALPGSASSVWRSLDPVRIATEEALWGTIQVQGQLPETVIASDGRRGGIPKEQEGAGPSNDSAWFRGARQALGGWEHDYPTLSLCQEPMRRLDQPRRCSPASIFVPPRLTAVFWTGGGLG